MCFHNDLDSVMSSIMKFIEEIREKLGKDDPISYRELAKLTDVDYQRIRSWEESEKIAKLLIWLCKLREISGESWEQFGRRLDKSSKEREKEIDK